MYHVTTWALWLVWPWASLCFVSFISKLLPVVSCVPPRVNNFLRYRKAEQYIRNETFAQIDKHPFSFILRLEKFPRLECHILFTWTYEILYQDPWGKKSSSCLDNFKDLHCVKESTLAFDQIFCYFSLVIVKDANTLDLSFFSFLFFNFPCTLTLCISSCKRNLHIQINERIL